MAIVDLGDQNNGLVIVLLTAWRSAADWIGVFGLVDVRQELRTAFTPDLIWNLLPSRETEAIDDGRGAVRHQHDSTNTSEGKAAAHRLIGGGRIVSCNPESVWAFTSTTTLALVLGLPLVRSCGSCGRGEPSRAAPRNRTTYSNHSRRLTTNADGDRRRLTVNLTQRFKSSIP